MRDITTLDLFKEINQRWWYDWNFKTFKSFANHFFFKSLPAGKWMVINLLNAFEFEFLIQSF